MSHRKDNPVDSLSSTLWSVENDRLEQSRIELAADLAQKEKEIEAELDMAKSRLKEMADRTIELLGEEFAAMESEVLDEERRGRAENLKVLESLREDLSHCGMEDIVDKAFTLIAFPEKEDCS
ncbi:hypothetical protein L2W58_01250 [Dethiosulfovibrio sp. F2B]|uniref:hypothetical protein n=1 Tax=Dethiosulfovibrio faecalis TaxID=2720018 RepID=UPI001F3001A8|nr:hypothetical protein [Dethiosulfovibrio faecalis]MCF4150432.1 hypothetical protein [Dethiosulfovibrio faecalis]